MTYGLVIYQEQVMEIAQKLAGYTLGAADLLRRAMGKKKKEVLDAEYVPFSEGMKAQGFNEASIAALWGVLVPFSDYAFNKAHTAAYGLVSYWTAYLKANYPAEYMAALLTSVRDDKDKSALYLNECRHMGIKVLPPDVNESIANFAAVGTDIRFGLAAIRNVGLPVVEAIIRTREEKGAFASFKDFLSKVPGRRVQQAHHRVARQGRGLRLARRDPPRPDRGARALHRRARRGEEAGGDRPGQPLRVVRHRRVHRCRRSGAFDGLPPVPPLEWDKATLLSFEREMLGLYVSDHPLFGIEHILATHADTTIASLMGDDAKPDGTPVTVAGLITSLQLKRTKKGDLWAIATVEDLDGAIECLFFPSAYMTYSTMLAQDTVCAVKGRVSARDDSISIFAQELTIPDIKEGPRGPVVLTLPLGRVTPAVAESLKRVLGEHPGATEVQVRLTQPGRSVLMSLDDSLRVNATSSLFGDLKALLGPACLTG